MSKIKVELEVEHPTIVVCLTPAGLKVTLEAWQHNAPVRLLAGLDMDVQRAIHQWRARFVGRESKFGKLNATAQDAVDEAKANQRSAS